MLIVLICISCSQYKNVDNNSKFQEKEREMYQVFKIDSLNNFYLIYAKKKNTFYKIVSRKEQSINCKNIIINGIYKFDLISNRESAPIIGGVKISPINVDCFAFDKVTNICIERNNGINDLYVAKNIKGLCIIKDN